jgi:hypothetical protein
MKKISVALLASIAAIMGVVQETARANHPAWAVQSGPFAGQRYHWPDSNRPVNPINGSGPSQTNVPIILQGAFNTSFAGSTFLSAFQQNQPILSGESFITQHTVNTEGACTIGIPSSITPTGIRRVTGCIYDAPNTHTCSGTDPGAWVGCATFFSFLEWSNGAYHPGPHIAEGFLWIDASAHFAGGQVYEWYLQRKKDTACHEFGHTMGQQHYDATTFQCMYSVACEGIENPSCEPNWYTHVAADLNANSVDRAHNHLDAGWPNTSAPLSSTAGAELSLLQSRYGTEPWTFAGNRGVKTVVIKRGQKFPSAPSVGTVYVLEGEPVAVTALSPVGRNAGNGGERIFLLVGLSTVLGTGLLLSARRLAKSS